MSREKERRSFGLEFRDAEGDTAPMVVTGYPVVFNSRSIDLFGFTEIVAPGAFTKTLRESNVLALWGHDTSIVLGDTDSGSLTLREDEKGLAMELRDPVISDEQAAMLRRGLVKKMSFGFEAIRDKWEEDRKADTITRTLLEVRLFEVSPVAFPAYPDTSVSARAIEHAKEIRSKFAPQSTEHVTTPSLTAHLADHRRMSLELALRLAR